MPGLGRWLWYLLPANPIVVRVVQNASRRQRHLWVRAAYLGSLIGLMMIGLLSGGAMSRNLTLADLAKAGVNVFAVIAYGQVALVCLLSPIFMAGAIGQEHAGQTFDILATTPLTNLQIVLGSLCSRLFFILALLLSGLPLFAVLLIFGGIPISSVFVSFLVAGLAALVVGSVAVALAVLRQGGRKAVFGFVIVVAAYLVISYSADRLLRTAPVGTPQATATVAAPDAAPPSAIPGVTPIAPDPALSPSTSTPAPAAANTAAAPAAGLAAARPHTTWITPLHPLLVMEASYNALDYSPPPAEDLATMGPLTAFYLGRPLASFTVLSLGISGFLLLACGLWVRSAGEGLAATAVGQWLRRAMRLGGEQKRRQPRQVWRNPIAWREACTRGNRTSNIMARWAFAILGLIAGVVLLLMYHHGRLPAVGGLAPADVFQQALKSLIFMELAITALVAVYMSSGCVTREREDGTLDLMLTTPVTPRYYVWGKLRGLVGFLVLMLAVPVLTLILVGGYCQVGTALGWPQVNATYVDGGGTAVTGPLVDLSSAFCLPLMLIPIIAACVAIGMWFSLRSRSVLGAVIPTLLWTGIASGLLGLCGGSVSSEVPFLGPAINAFSPVTGVMMVLNPWEKVADFSGNPAAGRIQLFMSCLLSAAGYSGLVWVLILAMVSGFDFTMRKLSGAN